MKDFGYCHNCKRYRDFEISVIPIPEVIKKYKKEGYDSVPVGVGHNVEFKCVICEQIK